MFRHNLLSRRFLTLLVLPAALLLLQACGSVDTPPPGNGDPSPTEPVSVDSTLPETGPGEVGVEYSFTFTYDENITRGAAGTAAIGDDVIFRWSFGDGSEGGEATVSVDSDGRASLTVKHTYDTEGRYGLVLTVEDEEGTVLAKDDYIIEIGELESDELELSECDGNWVAGGEGGYGVSIDRWDISAAPAGASFDFEYEAYFIPDKFVVEYDGSIVLDTGWRGNDFYEGEPAFPGGIAGPGSEQVRNLFEKGPVDEFVVTVIGPDRNTAWDYRIRCNVP